MPYKFHMHTDLMRSPGLQFKLQQRIVAKTFRHLKMRDRFLAVPLDHRIHFAVMGIPSDRSVNRSLVVTYIPVNQGVILAGHRMLLQLSGQRCMGLIIFGGHQQT
ncbi:hypothetical protein D3C73_1459280 [compost metagenome]